VSGEVGSATPIDRAAQLADELVARMVVESFSMQEASSMLFRLNEVVHAAESNACRRLHDLEDEAKNQVNRQVFSSPLVSFLGASS